MIVVDRGRLKFLLAGRAVTVDVTREYRRHGVYALGISPRKSSCRVQVVERFRLNDGTWRLTIKRLSGDEVRLFKRSGSYATAPVELDPADPDVLRGADFHEPEALSDEQLRHLAAYRPAVAHNRRVDPVFEARDRLCAELDEMMRSSGSREDRDKIRAARHHLGKLGQ